MRTAADRRLADLAAVHDGIFTLDDARRAGLTHGQIDYRVDGAWRVVHEGVYRMPGAPPTWRGDLRAACWAGGDGAAGSHRSAAELYELPGRSREHVEVTCKRWDRAQRPGIVVHESRHIRPEDIWEIDGIPVVRPELVMMQLAWRKPRPNYVEAVMQAARRKRLITYDSMVAMFEHHARRGLRGVKATRIALLRWNPAQRATGSEMETMLLQALRAHDLPDPVPQYEVYDRNGLLVARTDFGYPQWRITIEYDSDQEHLDEFQIARDERRRNRITATGHRYLVARRDDLRRRGRELCDQILQLASLGQTSSA